ncbi:MAG: histidine phosphatase family protein [Cytophagaceae bacterium]|nr:histidine phosphatase family protein [Cytophagaceae bacterium]
MGKKIYLIRHGQTDYNFQGIVQGSGVDTSLNDTGRKQAEAFYQKYQDVPFKKIYTSVLKRSIESVQKFIDKGIPWEKYPGLNEISWGKKDGKIINSEDDTYYRQVLAEWKKGNVEVKPEGGESPAEVERRISEVIKIIVSRPEEDTVLICMHGRAMRILLASVLHKNLSCMEDFQHQNLCLYIINYSEGNFYLERNNDTEHLGKSLC